MEIVDRESAVLGYPSEMSKGLNADDPGKDLGPDSGPALLGLPRNIVIMISSAEKGGLVGPGGATYDSSRAEPGKLVTLHETVIGPRAHHNPYQSELVALELALKSLPRGLRGRHIVVGTTSNVGPVRAISRPIKQSGRMAIYATSVLQNQTSINAAPQERP